MKAINIFRGLFIFWLLLGGFETVYAQINQFGKNSLRYNQLDQFYESYRFDVWHNLDMTIPSQKEYLEMVVANLENANNWMSSQKVYNHVMQKRIPVFLYKTHADMESSNLVGGFLPEGVGAFVEPERRRMVIKADFSKPLSRAIGVHELAHEFQFDILRSNSFGRGFLINLSRRPQWFFEGGAEFIAGLYEPHTRSDIRKDNQRISSSDRHFIPTWEALNNGWANPYSDGAMVFEFLEEKFGIGIKFQVQGFKQSNVDLGELIYDLTNGELGNPDVNSELFNHSITRFWMEKYGKMVTTGPKPYEENENFKGRSIMPWGHFAPMSSPVISPDGIYLAAFSFLKYGVALIKYEIPKEKVYVSKEEREKNKNSKKIFGPNGRKLINLTPQLPPVPWENIVSQMQTWPFNGFDASWSPDGNKIAFFAKTNRDHALIIINSENGKILKKFEFLLDQAFSPSFSPDGESIVFSAAKGATRDIYLIKLKDGELINITNDYRYDTAPKFNSKGDKIVFVGSDGDFQHLFLADLSKGIDKIEIKQLTFGDFNDGWPSWSSDGSMLVYASDEDGGIWNIYTLDLSTKLVRQWTQFPLGAKMPIFAKDSFSTIYYISPSEDTRLGFTYDMIFEAKLKKPIREYKISYFNSTKDFVFNPFRDLFKFELDQNQFLNPKKPPERWNCHNTNISLGFVNYWGMLGQGLFRCSNILETKEHLALFFINGDLNIVDYSYTNQEKLNEKSIDFHRYRMPYYYQFYDIANRYPAQVILNNTWITENALDFHIKHPMNKFNRLEFFSGIRNRSFSVFGYDVDDLNEDLFSPDFGFTNQDIQFYRFLRNSSGSNVFLGMAYVRDTVLYSNKTWGPFHGNAFRAQLEFAPSLGEEFQGYTSINVIARTYRHLGSSSLFAAQAKLLKTTRENGDFMLLCGPEMLRGCEYGSIIGNKIGYASAELRFPLPGTYVLYQNIRGLLFVDSAYASFSNDNFSANKKNTFGFGLHYFIPFLGLPAQSIWIRDNGKWKPSFYITFHW